MRRKIILVQLIILLSLTVWAAIMDFNMLDFSWDEGDFWFFVFAIVLPGLNIYMLWEWKDDSKFSKTLLGIFLNKKKLQNQLAIKELKSKLKN